MKGRALGLFAAVSLVAGCYESRERDTDASVRRMGDVVECDPGVPMRVGCAAGCGIGSCTGDPVMVICEGSTTAAACLASGMAIATVDDTSCGRLCPEVMLVCPRSGRITVAHRPFAMREYTCTWEVRPGP
jgi:hypothetical protein